MSDFSISPRSSPQSSPRSSPPEATEELHRLIRVARGEEPADLLIKGGRLVNVATGEVYPANVAICGGLVAGIGMHYTNGQHELDATGRFVIPGLIDAHMHLESSLLTPAEFTRAVLPHGTTSVVIDPHELANVLGLKGVRYVLEASRELPLNLFVMASSCVPATSMETSGASLGSHEIAEILTWERVLGVAEMMNVPAVLNGHPDTLRLLVAAREWRLPVDGHAPGLTGPDVVAYAAAGVRTDHECTTAEEALEKLRLGMYLMIREGSAARNLEALLPVVNTGNHRRCLLVTDDTHPHELLTRGHLDHALRKSVSLGMDPVRALQMATLNPAEAMGLHRLGAVLPGWHADINVVDDLSGFAMHAVVKSGKLAFHKGRILVPVPQHADPQVRGRVKVGTITPECFCITIPGRRAHVIGITENQLGTRDLVMDVTVKDGEVVADPLQDILKVAVVERHHASGNIGLGLVHGMGLMRGAMASTVSHDSHNLIVVGQNDDDMAAAVHALEKTGGGFVVVVDGQVVESLPLPVAGLMSDEPAEVVAERGKRLRDAAGQLGVRLEAPFVTMSFLALPVIPELRITDKGLVDVRRFRLIELGADATDPAPA
ncbi:MAG: adenine deaminase [Nitrospirota bacterium]|nr:adenine deaminase [Nitrospirota bacterium]